MTRALYRCGLAGLLSLWVGGAVAAQTPGAYFEFLMARRFEAQGDYPGALAALERAAAADPASAEVRTEIAAFQLRRDRPTEAERQARQALTLDDANLGAHRVLGMIYSANVDLMNTRTPPAEIEAAARQAITHLERAAGDVAAAADIEIQVALGRLYLRTGQPEKSTAALERVVDLSPTSAQGRLLLAQAYAASGNLMSAIETLAVIVDDEPRVASTLARYQEQAGRLKEAAQSYTRAIALEPTSRGLKFRRIATVLSDRDFAQAAALAAEAQAQHPDDPRFPLLQGRALFQGGEQVRAFALLEATVKTHPDDATTQIALADLYSEGGRDADAERTLRQLIVKEPANAEALNYLGYLLADRDRSLDEAVRLVQRALEAEPGNPSYLDSLGWAHFRRGDFTEAEKYLSPAASQLPRNSVVQDHLGDVLAGQRRWGDAIAAWTRALDGDGRIDRAAIDRKIQDARSQVPR